MFHFWLKNHAVARLFLAWKKKRMSLELRIMAQWFLGSPNYHLLPNCTAEFIFERKRFFLFLFFFFFFNTEWWATAFPFRLKCHCFTINSPAEGFQMTNTIMCHERETLFQLVLRYRFWHSVLVSIYRLDAHDLKNKQTNKKPFEYEFSLTILWCKTLNICCRY